MTNITRRGALFSGAALVGLGSTGCGNEPQVIDVEFLHGVASGDPTANSVIMWTRLTPTEKAYSGAVSGEWQISKTTNFDKIAKRGSFSTDAARDFTVKIDPNTLASGQTYFYRFQVGDINSPIGKTKTLPSGKVSAARLAIVSCSNYPFGFFNVYDHISKQDHFDAVIHLGDYFYEYGRDGYGGKVGAKLGREHVPAHEVLSLDDYRKRHAQYKSDISAQAMHAAHPIIAIWDDHETANDSWKTGAENHNKGEGDWDSRRANAMQAYYEWMPIRDPKQGQAREVLFRNYEFGDLFSLTAIETRLTARTRAIDYAQHMESFKTREGIEEFYKTVLHDPTNEMMGPEQHAFVGKALKSSKTKGLTWRIVANQILMGRTNTPDLTPYEDEDFITELEKLAPQIRGFIKISPLGLPLNPDAWDGYPQARERFYQMVQNQNVQDLIVLTGDTHDCWVNTLETASGTSIGIELGTSGVTSPGTGMYFATVAEDFSNRLTAKNPGILYHENQYHGYIDLHLTHEQGLADFVNVDTVYTPKYETFTSKSIKLSKHGDTLKVD